MRTGHSVRRKSIRWLDLVGEGRPKSTDAFEAEGVAGWSDGDYPPWLQKEMDAVVPRPVLRQYGHLEATHVNGDFWLVSQDSIEPMCEALRELGFELEHCPGLQFW